MNIEGRNPVIEALRSDKEMSKLYIQRNLKQDTKINELVKKAKRRGVKILRKNRKELDRISVTGAHQGVIAIIKHIEKKNVYDILDDNAKENKPTRFIYIREAYHEYNIGAVTRTAEALGFDAVILPPKISVTPQVARASMGASEHIPILSESLFNLIKNMNKLNVRIIGIERTENATELAKTDLSGDIMLIIGGEDKPLSEQIVEKCDDVVVIPMAGKVNSLNMSVAAAMVMYETVRLG